MVIQHEFLATHADKIEWRRGTFGGDQRGEGKQGCEAPHLPLRKAFHSYMYLLTSVLFTQNKVDDEISHEEE
jgi:hypothetical protein